jgi:hypothetical protein
MSEIMRTGRELEGTGFPLIIPVAPVDTGMLSGEPSEAVLFSSLCGRADLQQLGKALHLWSSFYSWNER